MHPVALDELRAFAGAMLFQALLERVGDPDMSVP
jgi:hypothetical protein